MTGWQIGYACGPKEVLEAMRKVHQFTIMSAPTTGQAAGVVALTDPAPKRLCRPCAPATTAAAV